MYIHIVILLKVVVHPHPLNLESDFRVNFEKYLEKNMKPNQSIGVWHYQKWDYYGYRNKGNRADEAREWYAWWGADGKTLLEDKYINYHVPETRSNIRYQFERKRTHCWLWYENSWEVLLPVCVTNYYKDGIIDITQVKNIYHNKKNKMIDIIYALKHKIYEYDKFTMTSDPLRNYLFNNINKYSR